MVDVFSLKSVPDELSRAELALANSGAFQVRPPTEVGVPVPLPF